MTKNALKLSFDLHQDQVDKGGIPYPYHLFYIANQMTDEESCCVALLHDILEDTTLTSDDLLNSGFSARVVDAVKVLSKKEDISFLDYIKNIQSNELARVVKLADLKHNMILNRLEKVEKEDVNRTKIYDLAIQFLDNPSVSMKAS